MVVMAVDWGSLRRLEPVSRFFGYDRGTPVDRYYIEQFLSQNADSIRGRVLEVGDDTYTRRFGGARVTRPDIFHVDPRNSRATFVGDLCTAATIPSEIFDCAIIVQTLQFLSDPLAGLKTLHRILRPSGILLMTVPGITVLSPESDQWSEMWLSSFTPSTIRALTEQSFTPELCAVEVHGNILAAVCALEGIAVEDVTTGELDAHDATYPVVITVRATKQF